MTQIAVHVANQTGQISQTQAKVYDTHISEDHVSADSPGSGRSQFQMPDFL